MSFTASVYNKAYSRNRYPYQSDGEQWVTLDPVDIMLVYSDNKVVLLSKKSVKGVASLFNPSFGHGQQTGQVITAVIVKQAMPW